MYWCMIVCTGNSRFMFKSCALLKKFEIFSFLDGSLYVITPVDPLFLILPYLTKFSQKVSFLFQPSQNRPAAGSMSRLLWRFDRLQSRQKIYNFFLLLTREKKQKERQKKNSPTKIGRFKMIFLACIILSHFPLS